MRKQFVATIENLMSKDSKLYLLLGDIGVFNFNKVLTQYNNRAKNIGILEQSSVSLSSGIAQEGMIPVLHTIAPFIVERAYEQIKIDLGYQELGCKLVSVGGSYDYAALGCTHHCPADVGALLLIPNIEIVIPGTAKEFDILFRNSYSNGNSTYYRLSENSNLDSINIKFGKGNLIKEGNEAVVLCIGNTLSKVLEACNDLDVTILYYTTVRPFDIEFLNSYLKKSSRLIIVEPYYEGSTFLVFSSSLNPLPKFLNFIGIPKIFLRNYGTSSQHDEFLGLTSKNIREKIKQIIFKNE